MLQEGSLSWFEDHDSRLPKKALSFLIRPERFSICKQIIPQNLFVFGPSRSGRLSRVGMTEVVSKFLLGNWRKVGVRRVWAEGTEMELILPVLTQKS